MTRDEELQTRILGLIRTQVEAIIADRDSLQAQCDTLTAENEALQLQLGAGSDYASQLSEALSSLRKERDEHVAIAKSAVRQSVNEWQDKLVAVERENDALRRERDALKADAQRLRWIFINEHTINPYHRVLAKWRGENNADPLDDWREAIDAAIGLPTER